jgi:hypothetical protein
MQRHGRVEVGLGRFPLTDLGATLSWGDRMWAVRSDIFDVRVIN